MKLTTESGHFWLEFNNGYTLSVFNGYGSHTENNFAFKKYKEIIDNGNIYSSWESELVEIAIMKNDQLITDSIIDSDDSVKTVDLKELIEIINLLNKLE